MLPPLAAYVPLSRIRWSSASGTGSVFKRCIERVVRMISNRSNPTVVMANISIRLRDMAIGYWTRGLAQADCEWGAKGIEVLGPHAAVLVIVDVLSFSTAVDVAVSRGRYGLPVSLRGSKGGGESCSRRPGATA
jgi:hypothetical protein